MTLEEAKKVANIVGQADGGCSICVGSLVKDLNEFFPEFEWIMGDWINYGREVKVKGKD